MHSDQQFDSFLDTFVPKVSAKACQQQKAVWLAETTGSKDAADLIADLSYELELLYNDKKIYEQLTVWKKDIAQQWKKRELDILIRSFKGSMIPKDVLKKIALIEADLSHIYANFRPVLDGKKLTENEINDVLKREKDVSIRKRVWEASKDIGEKLAPGILNLVSLRNESALHLGYKNYFEMQLDLNEVDESWLFKTFDELISRSQPAYGKMLNKIEASQMARFHELGPFAWSDPFGQGDPLASNEIDDIFKGKDILTIAKRFYQKIGFTEIEAILERSDLYEREKKNQHAFCIDINRDKDVRILTNIEPTLKWMDTVLHELGHAVYDMGFDPKLPWLLRSYPHVLTTEAMALFAGRQAHKGSFLKEFVGANEDIIHQAEESLKRQELIFSRWVMVMSYFEKELYGNPGQDLNALWWSLVEKYQGIKAPANRKNKSDWAAKYHIAMAPVYYYSYLLGEMFASSIGKKMDINILKSKLFFPGATRRWNLLIEEMIGHPLNGEDWLEEFGKD